MSFPKPEEEFRDGLFLHRSKVVPTSALQASFFWPAAHPSPEGLGKQKRAGGSGARTLHRDGDPGWAGRPGLLSGAPPGLQASHAAGTPRRLLKKRPLQGRIFNIQTLLGTSMWSSVALGRSLPASSAAACCSGLCFSTWTSSGHSGPPQVHLSTGQKAGRERSWTTPFGAHIGCKHPFLRPSS